MEGCILEVNSERLSGGLGTCCTLVLRVEEKFT